MNIQTIPNHTFLTEKKPNHCQYLYAHQAEFKQRGVAAVLLDGKSLNRGLKVKQNGVRTKPKQRDLRGINLQNHRQSRELVGKLKWQKVVVFK